MAYSQGARPGVPVPPSGNPGMARVAPMVPWYRRPWVRVAVITVTIGVIALAGLVIYGILGTTLGPAGFLLAAGAAVLPVPILVGCFMWLDRYEPEPWQYLAFAFAWGACVATAAALIINSTGEALITGVGGSTSVTAIFVAPPTEEFFKALPLFILLGLTFAGRRQINGIVDGIVYAGMSAVGFAFTENILYFGSQYVEVSSKTGSQSGLEALFYIFVLRGVFSPFTHPLFTCMTGIGVGIAARSRNWAVRILAPLGGLLIAISLHATWNALASSGDPRIIFTGYGLFMVPVFIAMVVIAIVIRSREARVVGKVLPAYAATGWFTPQEITSLGTMAGRRAGRKWAGQLAGSLGAKAMADYQFAATKLALLRDGLIRGIAGKDYGDQERELLGTLAARRLYIVQQARQSGSGVPFTPVPAFRGPTPSYGTGYGGVPGMPSQPYTPPSHTGPSPYGTAPYGLPDPRYPSPGSPAGPATSPPPSYYAPPSSAPPGSAPPGPAQPGSLPPT